MSCSCRKIRPGPSTALFPNHRGDTKPIVTPLSTIDSHTAHFSATAATWIFDAPLDGTKVLEIDGLQYSLCETLDSYPHFAGQLQWAPFDASDRSGHAHRYQRTQVSYGSPSSDPGVEFSVGYSDQTIVSLVPSPAERARQGTYDQTILPAAALLSNSPLPLKTDLTESIPGVFVRVTKFACGGMAIGVRFAHSLADAHTMVRFVQDWARIHRALRKGEQVPVLSPLFDPKLLDGLATGDVDAFEPDPAILERVKRLPIQWYDHWASLPGAPEWARELCTIPDGIDPRKIGPLGERIPWEEWEMTKPCRRIVVHFKFEEVTGIYEDAQKGLKEGERISTADALLGFVWMGINRARRDQFQLNDGEQGPPVHLDYSLGLRTRLNLSDAFVGSPIIMADVCLPFESLAATSDESVGHVASAIRRSISSIQHEDVRDILHVKAHEASTSRIWHGFLGRRHTMATSWVGVNVWDVDFIGEGGSSLRYVEADMPGCDGLVQIMEAKGEGKVPKAHWAADGVDVTLRLEESVMEKFLRDPMLRKYRS